MPAFQIATRMQGKSAMTTRIIHIFTSTASRMWGARLVCVGTEAKKLSIALRSGLNMQLSVSDSTYFLQRREKALFAYTARYGEISSFWFFGSDAFFVRCFLSADCKNTCWR